MDTWFPKRKKAKRVCVHSDGLDFVFLKLVHNEETHQIGYEVRRQIIGSIFPPKIDFSSIREVIISVIKYRLLDKP